MYDNWLRIYGTLCERSKFTKNGARAGPDISKMERGLKVKIKFTWPNRTG